MEDVDRLVEFWDSLLITTGVSMRVPLQKHGIWTVILLTVLFILSIYILAPSNHVNGLYRYCEIGLGNMKENVFLIDLKNKRVISSDVSGKVIIVNDEMYRSMVDPFLLSYSVHYNRNITQPWLVDNIVFRMEKEDKTKRKIIGRRTEINRIHETTSVVSRTGEVESILNSYNGASVLFIKPCDGRGFNLSEI